MKHLVTMIALTVLLLSAMACVSNEVTSVAPTGQTQAPGDNDSAEPTARPDRTPLTKGPVSPEGYQAILATSDLAVGHNRVGFLLTSLDGFVTEASVKVASRYLADNPSEEEPKQVAQTVFRPWPYGLRGLYTVELDFDKAGDWTIDIKIEGANGAKGVASLNFKVRDSTLAPANGAFAVKSHSKTLQDVQSFEQITTGLLQDPDLYQTSIADAVTNGLPTVVVMTSPAFCANEVCGPQVDVLQELKNKHKGQANFIHVDFYDNPDEIQGDLDRAQISSTVREWGLPSIEWTFVIDRKGLVHARFEGFATLDELEEALQQVL